MPKRRSQPSGTPLGVWLTQWLEANPEVTHAALAADVGVSKGLISQWAAGTIKKIGPENLSELARATGTDLSYLESLVYGSRAPTRPSALSPELLAAIEGAVARGVAAAIERLRAEGSL